MARSDYEIVGVVIRDRDQGNMSVTNDAEAVVAEIARGQNVGAVSGPRIFYIDSQGRLDEMEHNLGSFKGFVPVNGED